MTASTDTYRRELLTALKRRNVDPERIGQVLAEVESHLADSGEDPVQAFGPATTYARQFPPRDADLDGATRRRRDAIQALAGALVGLASAAGLFAVVRGDDRALGLPSWVTLAIGGLGAVALVGVIGRRTGRVVDPRTGEVDDPLAPWFAPVLLGAYVVVLAGCAALALLTR